MYSALLAAEVVVEHRLVHAGTRRDAIHTSRVEPPLGKLVRCRREDGPAGADFRDAVLGDLRHIANQPVS